MLRFFLMISIVSFSPSSMGWCLEQRIDVENIPEDVSEISVYFKNHLADLYIRTKKSGDESKMIPGDDKWVFRNAPPTDYRDGPNWKLLLVEGDDDKNPYVNISKETYKEDTSFYIDTKGFTGRSLFSQVPIIKFKFKDRELKVNLRVNANETLSKFFMLLENHFRFGRDSPDVFTCGIENYRSSYIVTFD